MAVNKPVQTMQRVPKYRYRRANADELREYFQQAALPPRNQPSGYQPGDPNTYPQGAGLRYSEDDVFDPTPGVLPLQKWANNNTFALTPFTIANVSQQLIPANGNRVILIVQNQSGGTNLFINFGQDAAPNNGLVILPNTGIILDYICPNDSVYAFFNNAVPASGVVIEGVLRG